MSTTATATPSWNTKFTYINNKGTTLYKLWQSYIDMFSRWAIIVSAALRSDGACWSETHATASCWEAAKFQLSTSCTGPTLDIVNNEWVAALAGVQRPLSPLWLHHGKRVKRSRLFMRFHLHISNEYLFMQREQSV